MFVPYSRNTVIRAYFDKYVDREGATLEEVANALGYITKNISDAVFHRGSVAIGYCRIGPGRYYSTSEHREGWDALAADKVLEDHLSGRHRVDKMEAKSKAEKGNGKVPYPRLTFRAGAEDWSHFHFWKAVLKALDELGAMHKGSAREVTEEIRPKLAEHKVARLDRVGPTLSRIANRLGWVITAGGDPVRWYLTNEYLRLSDAEIDEVLAQWDDEGEPIEPAVTLDLSTPEASYEEGPPILSLLAGAPLESKPKVLALVGNHRYEIKGEDFGLPVGARALVEVDVPLGTSAEEQVKLARLILAVQEQLLKLV